ncbi:hypothetical protein D3C77_794390 [compost metagenome]
MQRHQALVQATSFREVTFFRQLAKLCHFTRCHVGSNGNNTFATQLHEIQTASIVAAQQNEIFIINQHLDLTYTT